MTNDPSSMPRRSGDPDRGAMPDPTRTAAAAAGPATTPNPRRGRRVLIGLTFLCLIPVIASYLTYYVFPPGGGRVNYGELIEPQIDWPDLALTTPEGKPLRLSTLHGKWLLLTVDSGACGQSCAEKLYMIRQQRMITNKDRERVERVWLLTDDQPIPENVRQAYEGTVIARLPAGVLADSLPVDTDHIYIVDPLGHLMMRYPQKPDPDGIKKDIARLLRASGIG